MSLLCTIFLVAFFYIKIIFNYFTYTIEMPLAGDSSFLSTHQPCARRRLRYVDIRAVVFSAAPDRRILFNRLVRHRP